MSGSGLMNYESATTISQYQEPEQVIAEARKAAKALQDIITQKKDPVKFNGDIYLEFEDWTTVAKFYGCTSKVISTQYVEFGDVRGFEATAVTLDRNLNEIGRAESLCLSDEDNWGNVPVYEWVDILDDQGKKIYDKSAFNGKGGYKREKKLVGNKAKPLFQLKSMAQTRAGAKTLRHNFSWVVVLAGYKPSVAEEMTGNEQPRDDADQTQQRPPVQQPKRASEAQQPAAQAQVELEVISGVIQTAKFGTGDNGVLWMKVNDQLVRVAPDKQHEEMAEGNWLSAKVKKLVGEKIGTYYALEEVLECKTIQEGEVQEGEVEDPVVNEDGTKQYFDTGEAPAATTEAAPAAVETLVANGAVKPASSLPEGSGKKEGTIGIARAKRLYAIVSQNCKRTGYTHEVLKQNLAELQLEHLRDLPVQHYEHFEKLANGTAPCKDDE